MSSTKNNNESPFAGRIRFLGRIHVAIQSDQRMTLPKMFADHFSSDPLIVPSPFEEMPPHALLFPSDEAFDLWVDGFFTPQYDHSNPEHVSTRKALYSQASGLSIDKRRRIRIGIDQITACGLTKNCILCGSGDHYLELWSEDAADFQCKRRHNRL